MMFKDVKKKLLHLFKKKTLPIVPPGVKVKHIYYYYSLCKCKTYNKQRHINSKRHQQQVRKAQAKNNLDPAFINLYSIETPLLQFLPKHSWPKTRYNIKKEKEE